MTFKKSHSNEYISNVTVVIRSVGERTESYCRYLIEKQVKAEHVFVVNEKPFSKAIQRAFEIGIEQNLPYTLCIDADVLLKQDAIKTLREFANEASRTFEVQGLVIDYLTGQARAAGNHLYKTSLLPKAIEKIPEEGVSLRPESHMIYKMEKEGYQWRETSDVIGIHEYEQWHCDIFRKGFVHAHKHTHMLSHLVERSRQKADENDDFKSFLFGLSTGLSKFDGVRIDVHKTPFEEFKILSAGQLIEKEALSLEEYNLDIEKIISDFFDHGGPYLLKKYEVLSTKDLIIKIKKKVSYCFQESGWIGVVPHLTGLLTRKIGKRLIPIGANLIRRSKRV